MIIKDELRETPRATLADIETDYLTEYLFSLKKMKPNLSNIEYKKQLQLQGFLNNDRVTLASVMLFSLYPQGFFPRFCITSVAIPGIEMGEVGSNGERFVDNATIDGNLPQMLESAISFIKRNMITSTVIDKNTGLRNDKPQYPVVALREIVLNALIHRDYSIYTENSPIRILMYKDRIEVENPGGLYGRLTLDNLGEISADTRNPFIASAMETMKKTENRFSGIPTIRREMRLANLPEPIFENNYGVFKVTLLNSSSNSNSTTQLQEDILNFCKIARTRNEIAQKFSTITKTYLFTNYVNPLVECGKLNLTIPNKPKSKNQQFISNVK